jgi:hypothetical protein
MTLLISLISVVRAFSYVLAGIAYSALARRRCSRSAPPCCWPAPPATC